MLRKSILLIVTAVIAVSISGTAAQDTLPEPEFGLQSALSRVPPGDWETIAFTDFSTTMHDLDAEWPPVTASLMPRQEAGWSGVWRPELFSLELEQIGLPAYHLEKVVEARRGDNFVLWLDGQFDTLQIVAALHDHSYEQIENFPAEGYRAVVEDKWRELMPFISLPDGHTLLIASSEDFLQTILQVYDGLALSVVENDRLLRWLGELTPQMTSGVLRFDQPALGCPIENSRVIVHGLRYDTASDTWKYLLDIGFPSETIITNIGDLVNGLEFSTHHIPPYPGVFGQHTSVTENRLHESNNGSILQFILSLEPDSGMQYMPFEIARQPNNCDLFSVPPAAAIAQALEFIPDLSVGRVDVNLQFGNVEQALYNAGLENPHSFASASLSERQQVSLNSTWRTALAFENDFSEWFGFPPERILQTVELVVDGGDYVRVIWGEFTTADVIAALSKTGYVAVEQQDATRIFSLRQAPDSGGFLLSSLTQTAASPQNGILIFTNQISNMRLTLNIIDGSFRTSLVRALDLVLMSDAMEDATNVTLRRYVNPRSGGLVCGLPAYKSEGFANVLRPDGWHFLYALSFNGELENAGEIASGLGAVLENSDYPVRGPGSATFGELSSVQSAQTIPDPNNTVILIDLLVDGIEQQASFFGQDMAQAALPPCALGDITE